MTENTVTYEQPLNELIRVCLRLEHLFYHLDHQLMDTSPAGTRDVIMTIVNLLHLLDRPDLKAKMAKELGYHMNQLIRLTHSPDIDQPKLRQLLTEIEELMRNFIESSGKIGQPLREVELLNNLRLHLMNPGGGCSFDTPLYHYWLEQPASVRQKTTHAWLSEFDAIRSASSILLRLVREAGKMQSKSAEKGFYQELLDPQINLRLLRVAIPHRSAVYPEISVGRHFLNIRFLAPTLDKRPVQCTENLPFWLSYCTG
jgi:cell division protein ZapD